MALNLSFLQKLPIGGLKWLELNYKVSVSLGYVPRSWRKTNVIFIPKPGKDDYSKAKSFRPISLSSYVFKVIERVILQEIETKVLALRPLNKNQHAFRKGSSCDSALSSMVTDIEKAIFNNQYAMVAYLDISGAFDNLDPQAAIRGMRNKNFPEASDCVVRSLSAQKENHYKHKRYRRRAVSHQGYTPRWGAQSTGMERRFR